MQGVWKIRIFSTNISLYIENGTRYGHSYNERRIGTRMRSIEWCHFQWPWMTLTPNFKACHYSAFNISNIANLPTSEVRSRVTVAPASARAYHLPVGSSCVPMSAQHGAALPHRPAPTGEQRWLPAASTLVVVGHARCSSHRTRDHRWPCVQFNCSSCVEQFANGSAIFWVTGHFSTPSENWTVRAF